jgi:hypothetical protein
MTGWPEPAWPDGAITGVPFGPIMIGVVPVVVTGVPFGPMTGVPEPGIPGASVGVPFGPMTVGAAFDVTGKPFDPIVGCGDWARDRSVEDGTRGNPSVPTSAVFGLTGFTTAFGLTTFELSAPPP